MKRVALDWGTERVGFAASDDTGAMAFARSHFRRTSRVRDIAEVQRLVETERPGEIVMGLPLSADGTEGASARSARKFAERLTEALELPVVMWDERYSSVEAAERLREAGIDARRARDRIDAEAARIILQGYLDHINRDGAAETGNESVDGSNFMIKTIGRVFAALLMLVVPVLTAVAAREMLSRYELAVMPYRASDASGPTFVDVPRGARAVDAVRALADAGVVRDVTVTMELLRRSGKARSIRAGEYRFERALSPVEAIERLVAGRVFLRQITFPEGLHRYQMAERYESLGFGTADAFLAASADPTPILDLDSDAQDLEGYLFPDTYALGRNDGAEALVAQMVQGYRRAVGSDWPSRAADTGRTLREVTILASLVEKETAKASERPLVAGVYHARLNKRMLLQADPTTIYGLILEDRWDGNLKRSHLREQAPYNTYAVRGLPPGPIANPGRAALDAAFAPADTDFLYFVSKNDGSHVFSRTLREHNRRVNEYQKKYWREKWRRERAAKK